jgi:hypothetical protein
MPAMKSAESIVLSVICQWTYRTAPAGKGKGLGGPPMWVRVGQGSQSPPQVIIVVTVVRGDRLSPWRRP